MTPPNVLAAFQQRDWSSIPVEHIGEGIDRQMIWGDRLMVCRLTIAAHTVTAVHSHMHEQITLVERGRVDFFVDGHRRPATAGDVMLFPANILHGATMLDEEVVLIDIFSPPRKDFLPASGGR
ncbi:MAG: cupin domain-containing protein [Vicinamibacterales bacterium]